MKRLLILAGLLACLHGHAAFFNQGFNAEAWKWRTNILAHAGTISDASLFSGQQFMNDVAQWGVRSQLGRVQLYLGTTSNAYLIPIIIDWFSPTAGFETNDKTVAFVDGDFAENSGLTGGSGKWIHSNLGFGNFTSISNLHMSVYVRTPTNESSYCMGATSASATIGFPISYANNTYLEISSVGNQTPFADTNGVGHYIATRTATDARAIYKNGAQFATSSASDTTSSASAEIVVHAFNSAGTVTAFTTRTLSFYSLGYGITARQAAAFNTAVAGVQHRAGRDVVAPP